MGRLPPDKHRGRDDVLLQEERIMVGCACDTLHSVLHGYLRKAGQVSIGQVL